MTGDVRTSTLAIGDLSKGKVQMFRNPVTDFINVSGIENAKNMVITNMAGQQILRTDFKNKLDVSQLTKGVYFLRVNNVDGKSYDLKFIKK